MDVLRKVKLVDEIELIYGKRLTKSERISGEIPVYGANGIVDYHVEGCFKGPGIIIGRKGTVGSLKYSKKDFWAIDTTYVLKPKSKVDDVRFWYYFLKTLNLNKMNTHSAVPGLNRENVYLRNVDVLAAYSERKAVADILFSFDEKIEVNDQINKKLEEIAGLIFNQWFVDFEFPNKEGQPYKSSGGEMVKSELGMIPKGWNVKTLDDLTTLIIDHRGKTPKKLGGDWAENGYKVVSAKNIKNNRIVKKEDIKYLSTEIYNKWMGTPLEDQDILMTSEAPLGELYFLTEKADYCLSQRLYGIRADKNLILPSIMFMYLNTPQIKREINNRATGPTILRITQSDLRKVQMIVPSLDIQNQISDLIGEYLKKIYENEKQNEVLRNLRNTLLPKLMSGEIRVSEGKV